MSGIRIHHVSERNCRLLIHHPGEIRQGLFKVINKGRKPKDYPINLDNGGNAIVSETVWMRLQEAGAAKHFIVLNEVPNPPTLVMGMRDGEYEEPAIKRQLHDAVADIMPPSVKSFRIVTRDVNNG